MAGKVNKGKAQEVLSKTFVENYKNITVDEAEHLIAKAEARIKALRAERNADERLAAAQQIVKDLGKGYSSTVKYEEARIDYLLDKIENLNAADGISDGQAVE
jgi:hypothetical protein